MAEASQSIRIDKWLWFARFFKSRSLASKVVSSGNVRVNGAHIKKTSHLVCVGDTLTFAQQKDIRVVRIVQTGVRRGPAPEAQTLYEDLSPPRTGDDTEKHGAAHPAAARAGRPTKKLRRAVDAFKQSTS